MEVDMEPLLILGIIQGIVGGITGLVSGASERKAARGQATALEEQAAQITYQLEQINQFVQDNKIDPEAAAGRIAALVDSASEEVRSAMQWGVENAVKEMQEAYNWSTEDLNTQLGEFNDVMEKESQEFRRTWKEGFRNMQGALARGRLLRTEFGTTMSQEALNKLHLGEKELTERRSKVEEEFARQKTRLGEKLQSNIRGARVTGASEIARQVAGIKLQGGLEAERARERAIAQNIGLEQFGLTQGIEGQQQRGLLNTQAQVLEDYGSQGPAAGLADFFKGAVGSGAAGTLTSAFLYPQESRGR